MSSKGLQHRFYTTASIRIRLVLEYCLDQNFYGIYFNFLFRNDGQFKNASLSSVFSPLCISFLALMDAFKSYIGRKVFFATNNNDLSQSANCEAKQRRSRKSAENTRKHLEIREKTKLFTLNVIFYPGLDLHFSRKKMMMIWGFRLAFFSRF